MKCANDQCRKAIELGGSAYWVLARRSRGSSSLTYWHYWCSAHCMLAWFWDLVLTPWEMVKEELKQ